MAVEFRCSCGKKLKAAAEHAGKKVKCPQCGTLCVIPRPAPEEPPVPLGAEHEPPVQLGAPDGPPVPLAPADGPRTRRRPRTPPDVSLTRKICFVGACLFLVVAVVIFARAVWRYQEGGKTKWIFTKESTTDDAINKRLTVKALNRAHVAMRSAKTARLSARKAGVPEDNPAYVAAVQVSDKAREAFVDKKYNEAEKLWERAAVGFKDATAAWEAREETPDAIDSRPPDHRKEKSTEP